MDLTTALESLQQVMWQSDYSVTQTYFLNKDPAAANYTSFLLTSKAARKLDPGTSCSRSLSPLCKTSSQQVVHELSHQKMGPEVKDEALPDQHVPQYIYQNAMSEQAQKNKKKTTGKSQQNKFPTILWDEIDIWAMKQFLSPLALGTHYNRIKNTIPLHYPPNQGQQRSTPQGIKNQPPYEPKAFAWKRKKAKLSSRVIAEDS